MANIKISELNPLLTVEDADVLPIVDNGVTKKVTAAILQSYTQGNSVLLTGAQTVAGIKTFTSQIASSVATGTAPFSVLSTTKVTNLNADLLDGLSSADFALSTRTLTAGTGLTGGGDLTANRTFAIDSTVATLTGTQTLTNKTLTSPIINEILDSNGNEILGFTPIASATDYITIKNGIGVGVPLHISAAGSSTNTGIHLEPKGTGLVQISDGTDTTKGIRFRSSASATGAITLIDAVSSAGHVITLPNATTTLVGTNTTDTLTNKSISGATNTLSNIGNASLTNSAITINGTSTSLGGSINVGTVTSVAALTLGTSGTDVSSTVANGTTTPVITLNVPTASASNRGALSSTDWSTFNAKQAAITLTTTGTSGAATLVGSTLNIPNYADIDTGITSLNGLTALTQTFAVGTSGTDFGISSATSTHTFNLPTASATNRGALSSADWTTFNNKQNALTNPITGTGTTNYLPKFTGASALGNSIIQDNGSTATIGGALTANGLLNNSYSIGTSSFGIDSVGSTKVANGLLFRFGAISSVTNGFTATLNASNNGINYSFDYGSVGIGTTSPGAKLQIGDYFQMDSSANFMGIIGFNRNVNTGAILNSSYSAYQLNNHIGTLKLAIFNSSGDFVTEHSFFQDGNIGINTSTNAGYKLDVNGTARIKTTSLNGLVIETNDTSTLKFISTGSTKNWGFATTNLAVNDFGIYQSTAGGGDPINAGTPKLYFTGDGNVLINSTTNAGYKLDVNGTARVKTASGNALQIQTSDASIYNPTGYNGANAKGFFIGAYGTTGSYNGIEFTSGGNNENFLGFVEESGGAGAFVIQGYTGSSYIEKFRIAGNGNVGIGTTTPGSKLSIVGLPTSASGLSAGDIWNDGGTLKIV